MAKLHELLAVGGNLEQQAVKTRNDLKATFEKKRHLFEKKLVTFKSNAEGVEPVIEGQSEIQSTVQKELDWIGGIISKSIDVSHQIDVGNTQAKADIVTEGGETVVKDVPATTLLSLEKELKEVQSLFASIPTLDPAKGFVKDVESGYYRARDVNKTRTKKEQRPLVLAPATDKHAAQVQLITEDVPTGTIQEQEWSSLLTPAEKSELLERCDVLLRAVKKARARANDFDADVQAHKIGEKLFKFLYNGKLA